MDARGSAQNGKKRVLISSPLVCNVTIKSLVKVPTATASAAEFTQGAEQAQTTVSS
jgi:hypothetical protein